MKKTIFLVSLFLITIFLSGANATPVYMGDTSASWGEEGLPTQPTATGYYIWSNNAQRTSWSVRWTGGDNDLDKNDTVADWSGTVEFIGNNLTSLTAVEWDSGDGSLTHVDYSQFGIDIEFVAYDATAGWHWDGFDFTINEDAEAGRLRFNLGGSYYSDLLYNDTDDGVAAYAMWIGDGNVMNVNVATTTGLSPNYIYQSFEVNAPVPEPATMILLGTGLLGFAGARRKKKK